MHRCLISIAVIALLSACDTSPTENESTSQKSNESVQPEGNDNRWKELAGLYTGPEGMYLAIESLDNASFNIEMRWGLDDDMIGNFEGEANENGIRFTRNGQDIILKPATGDETGMKWLAGKSDCLMVEVGEGYCRK
ncbi:hypothetical protein [Hirschia litorea]|uniref:Lipoprotein n=1 Tax=Hirschia litorea TaxID=1199156 RepID=A0ABW2IIM5_9PROT